MVMDDDTALALLAYCMNLEAQREECPHGVHPDSGHPCLECLVNTGDEDAE
jgi:hypothetical protein